MKKYNFFGLLTVHLRSDYGRYYRYFDNEYSRIDERSTAYRSSSSSPSITLHIVKELPKSIDGDIQRDESVKKLFHYSYLIRKLAGNPTEIYFQDHVASKVYMNAVGVFLQAQVLEPIMYYKFLDAGVLLLHAAGVEKDSRGYLLPAHGGTGKTTLSLNLVSRGFKLLGDDLLLVDTGNKKVYPYPRPLHIFTYNIRNLKNARIPLKYSAAVYTKNIIRRILETLFRTEFLISTRIHVDEIYSGDLFGQPAKYEGIIFLRKDGPLAVEKPITQKNIDTIAQEIISSADLNQSLYRILSDYSDEIKQAEKSATKRMLSSLPGIVFLNTRKVNEGNLGKIISTYFD